MQHGLENTDSTIEPLKNGRYRHYKGQFYQVLGTARHSETREWLVVYRCLYDDYSLWVRPLEMFIESIVLENGVQVPRFSFVDQDVDDFVNSSDGEPVGNLGK
ncbi:DUF1653 domain-containing protein [Aquirhabdus parva]|uniref:DUF1653 domain-containing protein n=1 Tax=Aquirhabdus parva TaxID=2283318 RepID=A0A345PAN1_9GAMM|nr:DUF1653 domain-containing protein [Aquirhabdus parva]AXI04340.1 DUF1653 domain-containing protein [Aquirhabdus parva]